MKVQSDELRTFTTVIDSGSITAAADQLGLTASAVSRTLARLEEKLGTTLLNRTTRRMKLTEEGQFFLDSARHILAQMEDLEERLALRQQRPSGRLRINAASPFMLHAVVPHIDEFRQLYPDIELQLNTNDLNIDLLEQSTDVAIRIGALSDSSLHARSLGSSCLNLLASPAYLERHGTPKSVEALAGHSLLGFTQPETLNVWPLQHAGGDTLAITPDLSASSGETLRQLALAGQGIVCLAGFMTCADITAGRLVKVLPQAMREARQPINAVYYRNSQLALRIQCFLDFIQERLRGHLDA
ncbi:LysR family transcriptional regulator [Pseudomonas sp. QL9]|uniref:LysR family transcriptional regulator n=1 Tax=Pseudomonas sp. QL9 TaxID=3242725 RepID=UPI00352B1ACE